ncbi:MAG: hypothetical protein P8M53_11490 [Pirellulales bacterium]|nr:hypothetical protein [Pirellulales bacterium]
MEFGSSHSTGEAPVLTETRFRHCPRSVFAKHGTHCRRLCQRFFVIIFAYSLTAMIGCGGTSHTDYAQDVRDLGGTMHVHVELGGTKITDADLASLDFPDTVRSISLCDTSISDTGAQELGRGLNIEQIDLTNTKITDASLEELRNIPRLCVVNVASPGVSPQAFGKIRFFISDRMIKIPGRSPIQPLPRLPSEPTPEDFKDSELFQETAEDPLPAPERLSGYDANIAEHDGELQIHLDFQTSQITDDDLANMPLPENVRSISLRGTAITDAGCRELMRARNLEIVDLQNTAITDKAIPVLLGLQRLWKANISSTNVSPVAQRELAKTLSQKRGAITYDRSRTVVRPATTP